MSVEQLIADLSTLVQAVKGFGPLTSAPDIGAFLKQQLVPFVESMATELVEVNSDIEDLVFKSNDILHADTAELFVGVCVSGRVLMKELEQRAGNDRRVLDMIKEWRNLATQAEQVVKDITYIEPEDEEEPEPEDEEEPEDPDAPEEPPVAGPGEGAP